MPNGKKPRIETGKSQSEQLNLIWDMVTNNPNANIGILVHFKKQIEFIRDHLRNKNLVDDEGKDNFSYYFNSMPNLDKMRFENRFLTPFITTFDSCKGLEFDIVILPFFERSDWAMNASKSKQDEDGNWTIKEYNADRTEKKRATRNHYYVASTRAKRELHLLCDHEPNVLPSFDSNTFIKNGNRYS